MKHALELNRVGFSYDRTPVLQDVSLTLARGDSLALLGPNGAGKTTLTRLVVGLLQPKQGEIFIADVPNAGQAPEDIARDAAYVFQHPEQQLFASTVIEDVSFGPRQLGRSEVSARDAAFHALLDLGIEGHAHVHPHDLPTAERKLVTIAAALAQDPKLLVLDEPTQGLDRPSGERVVAVLRKRIAAGVTVLAVSHDLSFVAEVCERVVVLKEGKIALDQPAASIVTNPATSRDLGLSVPPAAAVSLALGLPRTPWRRGEVTAALRERLRSR